jgi:hypothetical protein
MAEVGRKRFKANGKGRNESFKEVRRERTFFRRRDLLFFSNGGNRLRLLEEKGVLFLNAAPFYKRLEQR